MNLQSDLAAGLGQGQKNGEHLLTVLTREFKDDGPVYFVAECLEIPGCVGQGDTRDEAEQDLQKALNLCLSVMFEDCLRVAKSLSSVPDLRGISSQRTLNVSTMPHLQYA